MKVLRHSRVSIIWETYPNQPVCTDKDCEGDDPSTFQYICYIFTCALVPFNSKCSPGISAMKYPQMMVLFLGSFPNITTVNLKQYRENRCFVCSNLHVNLHILRVSQILTSWLKAPEAARTGTHHIFVYSPWPTVPPPEWPLEVTGLYCCEHSKESTIVLFSV